MFPKYSSSCVTPFIVSAYAKNRSWREVWTSRFLTTSNFRIASTYNTTHAQIHASVSVAWRWKTGPTYETLAGLFCRRQIRRQRRLEPKRGRQCRKREDNVPHHFPPLLVHRENKVPPDSLPHQHASPSDIRRPRTILTRTVNHSSRVVTHRMLCKRSKIVCKLVNIDRYNTIGNGPLSRGSCCVCANNPCNSINLICR